MKIIIKTWMFIVFYVFISDKNINAQNESLRFERLGLEEGLSNDNINAILQDRKGFIWIGTMDGLNKYDGYFYKI